MPEIDDFVKASDEAGDYIDSQVGASQQDALEGIDYLMTEEEGRAAIWWDSVDVDPDITVADLDDDEERDWAWISQFAGVSAAATAQYFLENVDELVINSAAYRAQVVDSFSLTRQQLVAAGKRGTVGALAEPVQSFDILRSGYQTLFDDLARLPLKDAYRVLTEMGAMPTVDTMMGDAAWYVGRMTSYAPGSPQFKQAVAELVDHNSSRVLKGLTRRAVERVYSEYESGGDENALMVWLGEGGSNTCGFCLDNFGVIKTYGQWVIDGLPGADVCAGGNLCRCNLARVD